MRGVCILARVGLVFQMVYTAIAAVTFSIALGEAREAVIIPLLATVAIVLLGVESVLLFMQARNEGNAFTFHTPLQGIYSTGRAAGLFAILRAFFMIGVGIACLITRDMKANAAIPFIVSAVLTLVYGTCLRAFFTSCRAQKPDRTMGHAAAYCLLFSWIMIVLMAAFLARLNDDDVIAFVWCMTMLVMPPLFTMPYLMAKRSPFTAFAGPANFPPPPSVGTPLQPHSVTAPQPPQQSQRQPDEPDTRSRWVKYDEGKEEYVKD